MKKITYLLFATMIFCTPLFAQTNYTVDIDNNVYEVLRSLETQGLCEPLPLVKPYTQEFIKKTLQNAASILEEQQKLDEVAILNDYIDRFTFEEGLHLNKGYFKISNDNEEFPTTLVMSDAIFANVGSGFYANSSQNSTSWEVFDKINFKGDLGKNVSYKILGLVGLIRSPLQEMGEYTVGKWWYEDDKSTKKNIERKIKTYRNNSFLPYKYNKLFDGSVYFLENMYCDGLEGWPFVTSLAFGMSGDIHASFHNNAVEIGIGRQRREWGAMDDGSSLIMNANARPFLATEISISPIKYISLSSLTGVLEFPNQNYINQDAYEAIDSYYYQNAFSILMFDLDYQRIHFDFGSTCVWPKRFELGYLFPLIDNVIYQNDVGDYDNLALFGNIKYTQTGYGSLWFSVYLDEINSFKTKFWEKTRAMFAFQTGVKANIPWLPFTTASFRYTKVEPYCYTHQAINYTPWYDHYLSESYTNNGSSLGYYLAPNSDEFNLMIKSNPIPLLQVGLQYQLIRHGVDWGSRQGIGNNIYSELQPLDRGDLYKYFLHDGAYEWSNIITIQGSYDFNKLNVPVRVNASLGYIYDWFTDIGAGAEPGRKTPYQKIDTDEYPVKNGVVANLWFTVFYD